jgi:Flp pilus assembly pilin Flp
MNIVRELIRDEAGASLTEYAMLLALIAVATLGAIQALRDQIVSTFNSSASTLAGVTE